MPEPTDMDDLPQATVVRPRRTRISVVWIIPILAAAVALGIAIQRIVTEGPTITVVLKNAEGIEAGKTFVKYKDVNIGTVTKVYLTDGYSRVEVTAKIDKSAAGLMVEDAKFWVVEPRITLSGVSGLGTLLSGNYIGVQPGKSDKSQRHFTALDTPPFVADLPGSAFVLKASDLGSLGSRSPIYYRRLTAGQVVGYDLAPDGKGVTVRCTSTHPTTSTSRRRRASGTRAASTSRWARLDWRSARKAWCRSSRAVSRSTLPPSFPRPRRPRRARTSPSTATRPPR